MKIIIDLDEETKVVRSAQDEQGNSVDLTRYAQCTGFVGESIYTNAMDGSKYSVTHRQRVSRGHVYEEIGPLRRAFGKTFKGPTQSRNIHTVVCLSIKDNV